MNALPKSIVQESLILSKIKTGRSTGIKVAGNKHD